MKPWELVDYIDPVEDEAQLPRKVIRSEAELRTELERLRQRKPGVVMLESPQGECLEIALGGPFAALHWMKPPASRHSLTAVAPQVCCDPPVQFSNQGMPTHYEAQDLLPVADVMDAVLFFYRHHHLPDDLQWRGWNAATNRWEVQTVNGNGHSLTKTEAEVLQT
jgi:hypothetical protein